MSLDAVIAAGGVVLFPSDSVYGLAADPQNAAAVRRLYAIKGRPPDKPAALMFFDLGAALAALPEVGERTAAAMRALLPGPYTLVLPGGRGVRVIDVPAFAGARGPVLQSSANRSGEPDARRLTEVDPAIREAVDLEIDGGELPGVPSTVLDLRAYETAGEWSVLREGGGDPRRLQAVLGGQFHFDPVSYPTMIRAELADYEVLQTELVRACAGCRPRRILDLGTGTGETAGRVLAAFPGAELVGVDENPGMLDAARAVLPADRVTLRVARLQDPLPEGRFELVVSALAVHHLDPAEKRDLFGRARSALRPGGRFVLADVVLADDPVIELTPGYDRPSGVAEQLDWLEAAGFTGRVAWRRRDLAVLVADAAD